jgi:putative cardiolipin synthase
MGLIVESPELAGQLASLLRGERQPRSYQVRSASGSKSLQWVAQDGDAPVVYAQEPNARWATQLRLAVLSSLIDEELL